MINRVPPIFTGNDSNTRISPETGVLEADVPLGQWAPRGTDWAGAGGSLYQGLQEGKEVMPLCLVLSQPALTS